MFFPLNKMIPGKLQHWHTGVGLNGRIVLEQRK